MLPLLYTRHFVTEQKVKKMNNAASSMIYTDSSHSVYTVRRVDATELPTQRSQLLFELECMNNSTEQKIFVGLLETTELGTMHSPGIGISIDPETGLVMDLVNQQGVIGCLELAPLQPNQPIQIRIEVEVIRHVYLPRITIGTETILHPALFLEGPGKLSALVGAAVVPNGTATFDNAHLKVCPLSRDIGAGGRRHEREISSETV
jgi:hypothetical protein